MVGALTNESATSKAVYFAHCTSEMIYITHLLAEQPERLAGPLLADTYVTLLKGRNAWYGEKLAKGELKIEMGDNISGKRMIQVRRGSFTSCQCEQSTCFPHPVGYCF
jgi:glycerol-3-phosphate dehydrogenase (NAD+)